MAIKPPFTDLEINRQDSGFYEGYSLPIALISKGIMVALVIWALVWPRGLKLVYTPWMALAEKIGWFNTRLILFLIFYGVVLPIGLLMRLLGKDPLARKYDPRATSYRIENTPQDKDHMETPY